MQVSRQIGRFTDLSHRLSAGQQGGAALLPPGSDNWFSRRPRATAKPWPLISLAA
jgi:hypothetical protein